MQGECMGCGFRGVVGQADTQCRRDSLSISGTPWSHHVSPRPAGHGCWRHQGGRLHGDQVGLPSGHTHVERWAVGRVWALRGPVVQGSAARSLGTLHSFGPHADPAHTCAHCAYRGTTTPPPCPIFYTPALTVHTLSSLSNKANTPHACPPVRGPPVPVAPQHPRRIR